MTWDKDGLDVPALYQDKVALFLYFQGERRFARRVHPNPPKGRNRGELPVAGRHRREATHPAGKKIPGGAKRTAQGRRVDEESLMTRKACTKLRA
jgi:hypothetical protein